jgi:hypothetical protein
MTTRVKSSKPRNVKSKSKAAQLDTDLEAKLDTDLEAKLDTELEAKLDTDLNTELARREADLVRREADLARREAELAEKEKKYEEAASKKLRSKKKKEKPNHSTHRFVYNSNCGECGGSGWVCGERGPAGYGNEEWQCSCGKWVPKA